MIYLIERSIHGETSGRHGPFVSAGQAMSYVAVYMTPSINPTVICYNADDEDDDMPRDDQIIFTVVFSSKERLK